MKEEDIANQGRGAENEIKQRVMDYRQMLEKEKREKIEIAGEMASQNKRIQENLRKQISALSARSNKLQNEIGTLQSYLRRKEAAVGPTEEGTHHQHRSQGH